MAKCTPGVIESLRAYNSQGLISGFVTNMDNKPLYCQSRSANRACQVTALTKRYPAWYSVFFLACSLGGNIRY